MTKALIILLLLVSFPIAAVSQTREIDITDYRGWPVTVLHGDMVRVLDGGNRMTTVRLKSIDAPERDQPYGEEARDYLASLVSGKEVKVKAKDADDYGNVLGQVWVAPPDCDDCDDETLDVNLALIKAGLAWWTPKFASQQSRHDRKEYEQAEAQARESKRGLWAGEDPVPPWEWREVHGTEY